MFVDLCNKMHSLKSRKLVTLSKDTCANLLSVSSDAIHMATMEFKDMVEAFVKVRDAVDIHK